MEIGGSRNQPKLDERCLELIRELLDGTGKPEKGAAGLAEE